ncbi:MAG: 23S rRNA (adenine(2503)-C(2))-methyltransferase RlmN [Armatimonadia bacterium]
MTSNLFYELNLPDLQAWLKIRKQPGYRAKQVFEAAYQHLAHTFEDMTALPKDLREALAAEYEIGPAEVESVSRNEDTIKLLVKLRDGGMVECVRIHMEGSYTACISSQVGCAIKCAFCATGRIKECRSLTVGEIVRQVITVNDLGERVRNVVFMGMGEPFHNYANVVAAVQRLISPEAFAMSPRRITISTSGIVPAIHRYAEEGLNTELAVSLNASTDDQRRMLMPGVARWTLTQLLEACAHFSEAHKGQPVTFAYVLLDGVNDDFDDAERLGKLLKHQPHHINLIPFNEVANSRFHAPHKVRVRAFLEACRRHRLNVSVRHSKGGDIDAACGQLRAKQEEER